MINEKQLGLAKLTLYINENLQRLTQQVIKPEFKSIEFENVVQSFKLLGFAENARAMASDTIKNAAMHAIANGTYVHIDNC